MRREKSEEAWLRKWYEKQGSNPTQNATQPLKGLATEGNDTRTCSWRDANCFSKQTNLQIQDDLNYVK